MASKVLIIAEAGVNHNGDISLARKLIDVAAESGADVVKFQTFKADQLVSRRARKAVYQARNEKEDDDSQYSMLKRLELSKEHHLDLLNHCKKTGITFLSTAFDIDSVDFLESIGIGIYKIPSGEITNKPYLEHIAGKGKQVIMSTGMATMSEVRSAIGVLCAAGLNKDLITVLHCNTEYPTPYEDVNLLAMVTMHNELGVKVGYSDHTMGIEVPVGAVVLGAQVIEKHFTLSRAQKGPDHQASLEPHELTAMVNAIRNIEKAVGDGVKIPSHSEQKNITVARKSIVAAVPIYKGDVFSNANITSKRPGDGLSPMMWDQVIGKVASKDFEVDDLITL